MRSSDKRRLALCFELARVTDNRPLEYRLLAPIANALGLNKGVAEAAAIAAGRAGMATRYGRFRRTASTSRIPLTPWQSSQAGREGLIGLCLRNTVEQKNEVSGKASLGGSRSS
jgi:hypothetical protein